MQDKISVNIPLYHFLNCFDNLPLVEYANKYFSFFGD